MRTTVIIVSAFAAMALFLLPASAQQTKTAEEIVSFFAEAIDLGAERGICVGTEQECAARRNQDAAVPTGLDMLVNFNLDSAELTVDARDKLTEFAKALRDDRLRTHGFVVEGHTDARGSEVYNQELSERRAQAVVAFLVERGVEPERLEALGQGMSSPRVEDAYDPINRRVEMRINIQ